MVTKKQIKIQLISLIQINKLIKQDREKGMMRNYSLIKEIKFQEFSAFAEKELGGLNNFHNNTQLVIYKNGWGVKLLGNAIISHPILMTKMNYHFIKVEINKMLFNRSFIGKDGIQYFFGV